MLDSNYLIINRKPQKFSEMKTAGKVAVFIDEKGKALDYGVIALDSSVYAALYCDDVRNITLIIDKPGEKSVETILWHTEEGYTDGLGRLKKSLGITFHKQNIKLNRYAESVAEKLREGVRLRVTDEVTASDMVKCPECGMLNPAGSEYCLDCGAEIE